MATVQRVRVTDCTCDHVTVYSDRAEVSRLVSCSTSAAASAEPRTITVVIEGVTGDADVGSVRVRPHAEGPACTILEVSTEERLRKKGGDDAAAALAAARRAKATLENEAKRLRKEQGLLETYMASRLKPEATPALSSEALTKLLEFHAGRCTELDARLLELVDEIAAAEVGILAMEAEHAAPPDTAALRAMYDISITLSLPPQSGVVRLWLSYLVRSASWAPKYDLRASLAEAGRGSMSITYFGVIRQDTGEDWANVSLSLSTASPAMGGTPPAPPTLQARWEVFRPVVRAAAPRGLSNALLVPQQAMMSNALIPQQAVMERRMSFDADELSVMAGEAEQVAGAAAATASVTTGGAGAANFSIERRSDVSADGKEHKVTIAVVNIAPDMQYFTTPALEEKAYLQARCMNNSACPLLASDAAAVFLDGSFVANTSMKHTSPGEAFSVFLGVDPSVKISHKLMKKQTNAGRQGGVLTCKVPSRLTNEQRTLIHNTKPTTQIKLTVVQLLPRSSDGRIEVELIEPPARSVQSTRDNDPNNVAGEGALRGDGVMQNAVTNNVVFSKTLAAGEKLEIPFAYTVSWPHDAGNVEIM